MPLDNLQPLVDRLEHKRRTLVGLVVVANTAVALLLCVLVYSVVEASKRAYQEQAEMAAEGIASVAQCRRRFNSDHQCQSNIDQGLERPA